MLRILLFLLINFSALGIGSFFTSKEVISDWYAGLNKAPWTPPGWVFGAAWTTVMITFSVYMSNLWKLENNTRLLGFLFIIQWILNVLWNPAFFHYHNILVGLVLIVLLTAVITFMMVRFSADIKLNILLITPYFIWLLIATSLNAYIYFKN